MIKDREFFYFLFVMSIAFIILFGKISAAIDRDVEVPAKADLIIYETSQNYSFVGDSKTKIEMTVSVKNIGTSSTSDSLSPEGQAIGSRGECKALVEFTDDKTKKKGWQHFCKADIIALAAGATHTFFCRVEVPRDPASKYIPRHYNFRTTIDTMNWIDESCEWNNNYW